MKELFVKKNHERVLSYIFRTYVFNNIFNHRYLTFFCEWKCKLLTPNYTHTSRC